MRRVESISYDTFAFRPSIYSGYPGELRSDEMSQVMCATRFLTPTPPRFLLSLNAILFYPQYS